MEEHAHAFAECVAFAEERGRVLAAANRRWLEERREPKAWWAALQAEPMMGHFAAAVALAVAVKEKAAAAETARRQKGS